jgi:cobalt-zinc-cadmium efflux system protein
VGHLHHDHTSKNIGTAFVLNLVFAVIELIGGLFTNSVAILSDALHDFGDSLTLGLSWYFSKLSKKRSNAEFTYGYKRFNVIGAIISSIVLLTGSIFIIIETIPRLLNPVQPDTQGMIWLGILGVMVNGIAAFKLQQGHSITERAVYLHLLEDVLGWVATLIGAIVMHYTDFAIIDALLSILIAIFILFNVFKNLRQGFNIILQGTPTNLDIEAVHKAVQETNGVNGFHDCRAWTMDGQDHILSIHLVVKESSLMEIEGIKKEVRDKLLPLGVKHSTLEIEVEGADCEAC